MELFKDSYRFTPEERIAKLENAICCLLEGKGPLGVLGITRPNREEFDTLSNRNGDMRVVGSANYGIAPHLTGESFEVSPGVFRPVYRKVVHLMDHGDGADLGNEAGNDFDFILEIEGWYYEAGDSNNPVPIYQGSTEILLDRGTNTIDGFNHPEISEVDATIILTYLKVGK